MSQNTERLDERKVAWYAGSPGCEYSDDLNIAHDIIPLAREVRASRKLVADLRGTHRGMRCCELTPCHTITMIDRAGL